MHCLNTRHNVAEQWTLAGVRVKAAVGQPEEGSRAVWRELRKRGISHRPSIGQLDPGSDSSAIRACHSKVVGDGKGRSVDGREAVR